jgi:hypothetical protein
MDNKKKIFYIKLIHSVIFLFMFACLVYIFFCAVVGRYDWTLVFALAAIIVEGIVLIINRWTCPFTKLAQKYGDENGAVTDLFIPARYARHTFNVFTVIFIIELIWLAWGYFN